MIDLDEIVESFKLNIPRIAPERLAEIAGLLDAVPRTRLNQILDNVEKEAQAYPDEITGRFFKSTVGGTLARVREEIQKVI